MTHLLQAILLSAIIYCSVSFIEALISDTLLKTNRYQEMRFALAITVSILIGLLFYV